MVLKFTKTSWLFNLSYRSLEAGRNIWPWVSILANFAGTSGKLSKRTQAVWQTSGANGLMLVNTLYAFSSVVKILFFRSIIVAAKFLQCCQ
jgi:hypothetical protein